jgi:hypothetical protein
MIGYINDTLIEFVNVFAMSLRANQKLVPRRRREQVRPPKVPAAT